MVFWDFCSRSTWLSSFSIVENCIAVLNCIPAFPKKNYNYFLASTSRIEWTIRSVLFLYHKCVTSIASVSVIAAAKWRPSICRTGVQAKRIFQSKPTITEASTLSTSSSCARLESTYRALYTTDSRRMACSRWAIWRLDNSGNYILPYSIDFYWYKKQYRNSLRTHLLPFHGHVPVKEMLCLDPRNRPTDAKSFPRFLYDQLLQPFFAICPFEHCQKDAWNGLKSW